MMPLSSLPLSRRGFWTTLAVLTVLCGLAPRPAHAQFDVLARQVTVFGVLATPKGTTIDPKLKPVEAQLKKMLPNHGFKLIRIESKRMMAGEILNCDLGSGFIASSQIVQVVDPNGKIQMRVGLSYNGFAQYEGMISTPPNQISFFDKQLPNGERLVIGIGGR